jgi:hypothetical protein
VSSARPGRCFGMQTKDMTAAQLAAHYEQVLRRIAEMSDYEASGGQVQAFARLALEDSNESTDYAHQVLGDA